MTPVFLILLQDIYSLGDPISKYAYESVPVYSLLTVRYWIALASDGGLQTVLCLSTHWRNHCLPRGPMYSGGLSAPEFCAENCAGQHGCPATMRLPDHDSVFSFVILREHLAAEGILGAAIILAGAAAETVLSNDTHHTENEAVSAK